ncbi:hypothetical protein [Agilicoccus flavus]|uniref:hypothetical protein n=1 Tax=Agilicoccus flavus TaxID=2775968 RepID=UPI001CF68C84|nr:hypothetical protein [Agilicoccus flavus]
MSVITGITRRGGGVVVALGLAAVLSAPATASAATISGLDPSKYVLATETPALKAPVTKAPAVTVSAKAPTVKKSVKAPAVKAKKCAKGRTAKLVKGVKVCVTTTRTR